MLVKPIKTPIIGIVRKLEDFSKNDTTFFLSTALSNVVIISEKIILFSENISPIPLIIL